MELATLVYVTIALGIVGGSVMIVSIVQVLWPVRPWDAATSPREGALVTSTGALMPRARVVRR